LKKKILSLHNISKTYPGVLALDKLSMEFYSGEVHALLGENGAGKSTLIKTIAGAVIPDPGGEIIFEDGKAYSQLTPQIAKEYGVEVIYQEFNLIGCLTVAENICFGERYGAKVNYKRMREKAAEAFQLFDIDIDPNAPVYTLPSSKQQIVEISKAISRNARILIMDEPSAPLSVSEVEKMFKVIEKLKQQGVAIIYISHRMEEIFQISDKVSIMRDGKYITTLETAGTNRKELVHHMIGRELKESFPVRKGHKQKVLLEVEEVCGSGDSNISFEVNRGEILGLAGLVGAGRTELIRMIYGADKMESGNIYISGKKVKIKSPAAAIKYGIGLIPEDRKQQGCLLGRSIKTNISLSCLKKISRFGFINRKKENRITDYYIEKLSIKTPSMEQIVGNLSGGNQQKVVLGKTLAAECEIIIFDEPTRGIDVGAKQEIYRIISELAQQGNGIIMITSEMEELIGMSDRILVLYEGEIKGELKKEEFSQSRILELASGL